MIVIERQEEMKEYYVAEVNTYVFDDDVMFNCNIDVEANIVTFGINALNINALYIRACDINACNISALNISALNISAYDINARDIKVCNIDAWDINALYIRACDIKACNINAWDINARDIKYYAVCYAYKNIRCNSITGTYEKHKHFCLDGELIIKDIKEGELE